VRDVIGEEERSEEEVVATELVASIPEELLGLAEEQQYITYDDILEYMPNAEEQLELLEELFAHLHEQNPGQPLWSR